jgi:hypothetical protein
MSHFQIEMTENDTPFITSCSRKKTKNDDGNENVKKFENFNFENKNNYHYKNTLQNIRLNSNNTIKKKSSFQRKQIKKKRHNHHNHNHNHNHNRRQREKFSSEKEFLNNSLTQAIYKMSQSSSSCIIRIKLFLFVVCTTSLASFMVIQSIIAYMRFDVITTTRTVFEQSSFSSSGGGGSGGGASASVGGGALFPQVTICNKNMFQTEFALEFLKNVSKERFPRLNIDAFDVEKVREHMSLEQKEYLYKQIHQKGKVKIKC